MPIKLSVVTITKNEESMIGGCLESIKAIADEIIIIDDLSTDKTLQIAKKYTKKIYKNKLKGFASQKNLGISKARGEWILVLDADERISGKLAKEIKRVINQKKNFVAYAFPRVNYFLAKRMNYGGWQDDRVTRLFKKRKAKYASQEIHEYLNIRGKVGNLRSPVYHFSHRTILDNIYKIPQFCMLQAQHHHLNEAPQVTKWLITRRMLKHFFYRYVRRQGYRDGVEGFLEALFQTFSYVFIIQSMLWEKQRGGSAKQLYANLDDRLKKKKFNFN
jgi:glycosyltransferase involved in cell wall biosynthesis